MRFDPAVVSYLPRYTKSGGIRLLNHFIPGGVEVASTVYVVNRDKKTFGEDADTFRPERYLDLEWANWAEKREIGFDYGMRKCLGKDLSLFLLTKVVYEVWDFYFLFFKGIRKTNILCTNRALLVFQEI